MCNWQARMEKVAGNVFQRGHMCICLYFETN